MGTDAWVRALREMTAAICEIRGHYPIEAGLVAIPTPPLPEGHPPPTSNAATDSTAAAGVIERSVAGKRRSATVLSWSQDRDRGYLQVIAPATTAPGTLPPFSVTPDGNVRSTWLLALTRERFNLSP